MSCNGDIVWADDRAWQKNEYWGDAWWESKDATVKKVSTLKLFSDFCWLVKNGKKVFPKNDKSKNSMNVVNADSNIVTFKYHNILESLNTLYQNYSKENHIPDYPHRFDQYESGVLDGIDLSISVILEHEPGLDWNNEVVSSDISVQQNVTSESESSIESESEISLEKNVQQVRETQKGDIVWANCQAWTIDDITLAEPWYSIEPANGFYVQHKSFTQLEECSDFFWIVEKHKCVYPTVENKKDYQNSQLVELLRETADEYEGSTFWVILRDLADKVAKFQDAYLAKNVGDNVSVKQVEDSLDQNIQQEHETFDVKKLSYQIVWSDEDDGYVGTCIQVPSLSFLAPTMIEALEGIKKFVEDAATKGKSIKDLG